MLAVRYHGVQDVKTEDITKPTCGPDEVLVKVAYAGICGSDLHVYRKGMFVTSAPVTMGHEFSGVVEEVGANVRNVKPGDHVVGDPRISCGTCRYCKEGDINLCPGLGFIGEVSPGCFAEYIVMKSNKLLTVPPTLDLKKAALVEPLAVALHIAHRGGFAEKDTLGIVGAGPIGLLTVMAAKQIFNVPAVAVLDVSAQRLEWAKKLGADHALRTFTEDLSLVDVAVEAVGIEPTLNGAIQWVKPGGRLVMAGIYEKSVQIDPNEIVNKELNLVGINAYNMSDLKESIELMTAGKIDVTPLISHVLPVDEAPKGFDMLTSTDVQAIKILIQPSSKKG